jgi:hypothetical protein
MKPKRKKLLKIWKHLVARFKKPKAVENAPNGGFLLTDTGRARATDLEGALAGIDLHRDFTELQRAEKWEKKGWLYRRYRDRF